MLVPLQPGNFDYFDATSIEPKSKRQVSWILVPEPPIGNKVFCMRERGLYLLEEGATILRSMACTHAGSGGFIVYDGVPDENGFFIQSDEWQAHYDALLEDVNDTGQSGDEIAKRFAILEATRNGRILAYANPAVMGMWMFDGGCIHGLTIENSGEHDSASPIVTITWMKERKRK